MTFQQTMQALEKSGTAQNRKVYARHGIGAAMFGVSWAALDALAKQIGRDQALAESLWKTGNHDARVLATKIADPAAMPARVLDAWAKGLDNYVIADAVAKLAAATRFARARADRWSAAAPEFVSSAGWHVVGILAMQENDLPESYFREHLETIESDIHRRKNRVRHAMNQALICIGLRGAALRKQALAAARRIGTVEVDHGETGCKTPDAAAYVAKTMRRRRARKRA
jgi:3-methyladenine DNA glycosylase AlkD